MRPHLVFTGPTLPHAEARQLADAILLPPAVQGSIVAAVKSHRPRAIVLIDGGFQSEPALRHREILWSLSQGIAVIGAGSMGALRAAELYPQMQGVGFVYRWYRRFLFTPDDAVAVLHAPPELDFAPLTEALIELRMTFRMARRRGLISAAAASRLDLAARALNFRERTLQHVVRDAFPNAEVPEVREICDALSASLIRQKKVDAIAALGLLRDCTYRQPDRRVDFHLTAAFVRDLADAGLAP